MPIKTKRHRAERLLRRVQKPKPGQTPSRTPGAPETALARPLPPFIPELRAAIRAGIKTRTRRLLVPQPPRNDPDPLLPCMPQRPWPPCPVESRFGEAGDLCYLREPLMRGATSKKAHYVDDAEPVLDAKGRHVPWRWKRKVLPQIFMPRIYARTFVRLTLRRAEWLEAITGEEAQMEGVKHDGLVGYYCDEGDWNDPQDFGTHRCNWRAGFIALWDRINAPKPVTQRQSDYWLRHGQPKFSKPKYAFHDNPAVMVLGFELVKT